MEVTGHGLYVLWSGNVCSGSVTAPMASPESTKPVLGAMGAADPALTTFVPERLQKKTVKGNLTLGFPEDKLNAP